MRSLQLASLGRLHVTHRPLEPPGPGDVPLTVTHCAVCRTDAKIWERGHRDLLLPRVLGHEICARHEASGERFVVWPGVACGTCRSCLDGAENLCPRMRILGFHRDGGFAEGILGPRSSLIPIPSDLPGRLACLAEPLACALNGLEQAGVAEGERILIYGAGPVGLLMALAASSRGAEPFLLEVSPSKLDRSASFRRSIGIESGLECSRHDFDAALNATPAEAALRDGLSRLRPGGRFCLFSGLLGEGIPVPTTVLNEIHYRQMTLTGAYGCTRRQMRAALQIIADSRQVLPWLVERVITLEEVPQVLPTVLSGQAMRFVVQLEDDQY